MVQGVSTEPPKALLWVLCRKSGGVPIFCGKEGNGNGAGFEGKHRAGPGAGGTADHGAGLSGAGGRRDPGRL